jgi:hypothetical protein
MLAIADRYAQHCKVALRQLCVSNDGVLKFNFDRRLMLQFRGSVVISNAGSTKLLTRDEARRIGADIAKRRSFLVAE